jgi:single-strand DNA-binding protein
MLYIEGEINYSQYEKDGVTKYSTDIIVREFNFVGDGGGNQNTQQGGGYQGNQAGNQQGNQGGGGYQSNNPPSQGNQGANSNNFQGQTNPGMTGGQGSIPDDDIPF